MKKIKLLILSLILGVTALAGLSREFPWEKMPNETEEQRATINEVRKDYIINLTDAQYKEIIADESVDMSLKGFMASLRKDDVFLLAIHPKYVSANYANKYLKLVSKSLIGKSNKERYDKYKEIRDNWEPDMAKYKEAGGKLSPWDTIEEYLAAAAWACGYAPKN